MAKGWRKEPRRHSLASRGIKTANNNSVGRIMTKSKDVDGYKAVFDDMKICPECNQYKMEGVIPSCCQYHLDMQQKIYDKKISQPIKKDDFKTYSERVRELEEEGLTTSDAQGVVDVEIREGAYYPDIQRKVNSSNKMNGWKKNNLLQNGEEYVSKKHILLIYEGQIDNLGNNGWIVEVGINYNGKFAGLSGLPSKVFRTKKEAKDYAIKYMR